MDPLALDSLERLHLVSSASGTTVMRGPRAGFSACRQLPWPWRRRLQWSMGRHSPFTEIKGKGVAFIDGFIKTLGGGGGGGLVDGADDVQATDGTGILDGLTLYGLFFALDVEFDQGSVFSAVCLYSGFRLSHVDVVYQVESCGSNSVINQRGYLKATHRYLRLLQGSRCKTVDL